LVSSLIIVLAVALTLGVGIVHTPSTYAVGHSSKIILDYGASGYHYLVVPVGDDPGFQNPGYNASSFKRDGIAAFGFAANGCPLDKNIKTPWASNTDLLIRRTIDLPAGTTGLTVHVAIDNDAIVYWNGKEIGSTTHDGCAQLDSLKAHVPDKDIQVGKNLLAIRGTDRGASTYLDLQISEK
jgi:hypothetical protein